MLLGVTSLPCCLDDNLTEFIGWIDWLRGRTRRNWFLYRDFHRIVAKVGMGTCQCDHVLLFQRSHVSLWDRDHAHGYDTAVSPVACFSRCGASAEATSVDSKHQRRETLYLRSTTALMNFNRR